MNAVVTVGIDLAKNVFAVHGVDASGRAVLRRVVSRAKLAELVAQLDSALLALIQCPRSTRRVVCRAT